MPNIGILFEKPKRKLSFTEATRVAELLAQRLKMLNERLLYPYNPGCNAKRVEEIHAALKAISDTPNGCVNRETLGEWLNELGQARDQLVKWCGTLLSFPLTDGDDGEDDEDFDDDIAF